MCRLYGLLANEETKVECSLVHAQNALLHQSRSDVLGRSHPDGWGVATYENTLPHVFRGAAAAFEDLSFPRAAESVYATLILAHVRLATVGGSVVGNTHPFVRDRWAFAHNGTLRGFDRLRGELVAEMSPALREGVGDTDSEHLFRWLLTRIREEGLAEHCDGVNLDRLADLVAESLVELSERSAAIDTSRASKLNVLLTDGHVLVAARWGNTLHWILRNGVRDCEICGIPHVHHDAKVDYRAVVVASEPISHEQWEELPDHSVLTVDHDVCPRMQPIPGGVPPRPEPQAES